jgi:hypothetical protein
MAGRKLLGVDEATPERLWVLALLTGKSRSALVAEAVEVLPASEPELAAQVEQVRREGARHLEQSPPCRPAEAPAARPGCRSAPVSSAPVRAAVVGAGGVSRLRGQGGLGGSELGRS